MNLERLQISITGQVQGVGFRPHVYQLANKLGLTGWVKNNAAGVLIEVQGWLVAQFVPSLINNLPPLAKIETIQTVKIAKCESEAKFEIIASEAGYVTAKISPDVGMCSACLQELFEPENRYHLYPFLNCTQCGPRLTIIHDLPYDRINTSMVDFALCDGCSKEYEDPNSRRYHAQPIACANCGPELSLPLNEIARAITDGKILAIKGLGGYQLMCDAYNETAILQLRQRKNRIAKPFAIMMLNRASVKNILACGDEEEKLLTDWMRPIVLLRKEQLILPEAIAPGLVHLGVMLPSTPLHYLLFHALLGFPAEHDWLQQAQKLALIVTSANLGDNPLLIEDEIASEQLSNIADKIVSYNRRILTRVDDSVLRVINQAPFFIRRARAYVPNAIKLVQEIPNTFATGSYSKNTFCITRGNEAFVSQHLGDFKNSNTISFFHETLSFMLRYLNVKPERVAHDLHPDLYTTRFAQEYGMPAYAIQHHHAHLASVAAEHHIKEPVLGLVLDGYGYGDDGGAWGGELMLLDEIHYQKLGSLQPLPLIGGDIAAREPWRMAVSVLHMLGKKEQIIKQFPQLNTNFLQILDKKINVIMTSSCGRLFDAASALLNVQAYNYYEGQAAMMLESLVTSPEALSGGYQITEDKFNMLPTLEYLLECTPRQGANLFHGTLIKGLAIWIREWAHKTKIKKILLSGGCFLNQILTEGLVRELESYDLNPLLPIQLPPNDGGLSLGQAWIAGRS